MKKTQIGVFALVTVLMFSLSAVPTAFSLRYGHTDNVLPTYDSQEVIEGRKWLYWNDSSDSAAIILFGGYRHSTYVRIRHLDDNETTMPEFSWPKYDFIVELHANGLDILTPNEHINYNTQSTWLTDVADWLQNRTYNNIYLFGFSAGGIAVGYEIQRPNADELYTAAFIASAPVDNDNYGDEYTLWHTADTAANTTVRTGFLCHPQDELGCYDQMQTYYNNTPSNIPTEWHRWGDKDDPINYRHIPFPDRCQDCNKTISEAVYCWFKGCYRLTIQSWYGGHTVPSAGDHYYPEGTNVPVTAYSDNPEYWNWSHWTLDGQPYSNYTTVTVPMTSDHTLKPIWIYIPPEYCLTIQSWYGGHTVPSAGNYYYPQGTNAEVTAYVNDPDYWEWSHWILDGQPYSNDTTVTVPMYSNHTLKPFFVYSPPEYLVVLEGWGFVGGWVPLFGWAGYLPEGYHTFTVDPNFQGLTFVCWYYDGEYRDYGQTSITKWIDSDSYFAALYSAWP